MRELSTLEDFVLRTLGGLRNRLEKLAYCASLRERGRYEHWGLERHHGSHAAQQAIRQAHQQTLQEVLRTPLPELTNEVLDSGTGKEHKEKQLQVEGTAEPAQLLPEQAGEGPAAHLSYVLRALQVLTRRFRKSSHQAA